MHHSMTPCARSIGGILRHAGFADFLGNQQARKVADDPLRRAIGILGAAQPNKATPSPRVGEDLRPAGPFEDADPGERAGYREGA